MQIPTSFLAIGISVAVTLQAWTLTEIVKLKTDVAVLKAFAHVTTAETTHESIAIR